MQAESAVQAAAQSSMGLHAVARMQVDAVGAWQQPLLDTAFAARLRSSCSKLYKTCVQH